MDFATTKARLLLLADFLDKLPEEKFYYGSWVNPNDPKVTTEDLVEPVLHKCGTTACALGWACSIPELKEAGLKLNGSPETEISLEPFEAGAEIFGISKLESGFLFGPGDQHEGFDAPDEDATAKEVAHHIRNFITLKENGDL